jgi:peptidoglycan/LPS O-acetylase OafA/YrhL
LGILLLARIEISKVPYAWQFMLGFAYALVIVSLAGCKWRFPWYRLSACLAEFSYSVYLIHFPVLMFMLSVAFEISGFGIRIPFGAVGFCWYSLVFVVAILASWLISLFTESKTTDLRSMLYRLFRVSRDL